MDVMTKNQALLALLALYTVLMAGMHLYLLRGKVAKPFTLAAQAAFIGTSPDMVLPDGFTLHWYDDTFTCPYTRCWSVWMNATNCVMVWEERSPCEKRIENVCHWLYPPPGSL